jgi:DNA-binding SARP family transcriptional activator
MALLAVARERGISRDKVVAYLWSESDAPRARHALNQLLHAQRKQFAPGDLILGGKTLRLNPSVIRTDVGEFEGSLERGAVQEAVAMWGGPFLDGFFLRDAPEFERWVEGERHRLARRIRDAYVDLAKAAMVEGARDRSAQWWHRAADLDPLDSEIAINLVEALAAMGNRAGAIRHAQLHHDRLRDELGIAPDQRLEALVARLRADDTPGSAAGRSR